MTAFRGSRGSAQLPTILGVFVVGALVGALAAVEIVPAGRMSPTVASVAAPPSGTGAPVPGSTNGPTAQPSIGPSTAGGPAGQASGPATGQNPGSQPVAAGPSRFECRAGANGGATDRGVTASQISLATTVVQSGIGSSFLGEMRFAMDAAITKVNRDGGICGRQLSITYKDDGWNPQTGAQYLRNFIEQGVFAIPVGASSEGLQVVIKSGDLDRAQIPVVGTDGLAIDQYARSDGSAQPWVWPIATATVSSARIMAADAYRRGARRLGVVFDSNYRFGAEGASAFDAEYFRLSGKHVEGYNTDNTCNQLYCGIQAGQNSYSSQAAIFSGAKPDFIALFLEPQTALTWMQDPNTPAATSRDLAFGYGGAQPLFTYQFESQCGNKCDQMVVWTGFKPNVEQYTSDPAVTSYVNDLRSVNPQADPYNQFSEGAYVGMQALIQALQRVGPELTRARLKAVLDTMKFAAPLTLQGVLPFSASNRFANVTMQAFTMQFKGTPGGWRTGETVSDSRASAGPPA